MYACQTSEITSPGRQATEFDLPCWTISLRSYLSGTRQTDTAFLKIYVTFVTLMGDAISHNDIGTASPFYC